MSARCSSVKDFGQVVTKSSSARCNVIPVRALAASSQLACRSVAIMKSGWLDRLAPLAFVLVWSTGFVGAKYGTEYASPFTLLALRLALASAALALLALLFRSSWPRDIRSYQRSSVIGILLHASYLGGTFVAVHLGLPVSVAALIVSLQPVLVATLSGPLLGEVLTRRQWMGIALGFGGVVLVLAPGLATHGTSGSYSIAAVAASVVSLLSTTSATLLQKRYGAGIPMLPGTAIQYAAATVVLVIAALLFEDSHIDWEPQLIAVLFWMIAALSIGAVLLMFWLLRRGTAASFSSLYFLVPPVTLLMGYLLFGEELPALALIGLTVSSLGVLLVRERSVAATPPPE